MQVVIFSQNMLFINRTGTAVSIYEPHLQYCIRHHLLIQNRIAAIYVYSWTEPVSVCKPNSHFISIQNSQLWTEFALQCQFLNRTPKECQLMNWFRIAVSIYEPLFIIFIAMSIFQYQNMNSYCIVFFWTTPSILQCQSMNRTRIAGTVCRHW